MLLIFSLLNSGAAFAGEDPLTGLEQSIEKNAMQRLADVQQGATPAPFSTDGCSGGLSAGWEFLAKTLPTFRGHFGSRPPWHNCCVIHDQVYWLGSAQNGYQSRLQADIALKTCAKKTGLTLAPSLSQKYGLQEKDIISTFNVAAELMFQAVRRGGQPCTLFSWRWGYGWPLCKVY